MLYALVLINSKNHNSDLCNEFICALSFYEFMSLNLMENLWFSIMSTAVVMQRSFNQAAGQRHCCCYLCKTNDLYKPQNIKV